MNNRELICLIDWMQFTIKTNDLQAIYSLLSMDEEDFTDMSTGLYLYKKRKACGHIWIMYEGNKSDMGIHVQMSGQGCREYETFFDVDWLELIQRIVRVGGQFSRLDLALDDIRYNGEKPYWTVRKLISKVQRGEIVSQWRKSKLIRELDLSSGETNGDTLYLGSDSSKIQLTMYEKDKERLDKGLELEEGLTSWNRAELHLYDERAMMAVAAMIQRQDAGQIFCGVVREYIRFLDRKKGDTNKTRWKECNWWLEYLNHAERLKLSSKAPDKTIETKRSWLDKQVIKTFATVYVAEGMPDALELAEWIDAGMQLMTDQDWELANLYRKHQEALKELERQNQEDRIEKYEERLEGQLLEFRRKKTSALQSARRRESHF